MIGAWKVVTAKPVSEFSTVNWKTVLPIENPPAIGDGVVTPSVINGVASCGIGVICTVTGVMNVPAGQLAPTVTGAASFAIVAILTTPGAELVAAAGPTKTVTDPAWSGVADVGAEG